MKSKLVTLVIGLGAITAAFDPASAADWNNGAGGIRDYTRGGAVPVPAPIPAPDYYAKWYLRLDAGIGFVDTPSASESGMRFGLPDSNGVQALNSFGADPAWLRKDYDTSASFGLGAGYYWTSRFRTDITADTRSQQLIKTNGTFTYQAHQPDPLTGVLTPVVTGVPVGLGGQPSDSQYVDGTVRDQLIVRSSTIMFNGYYDLMKHAGITPYVGAGLGIGINELERQHTTVETSRDCVTPVATEICNAPVAHRTTTGAEKTHSVTLAWALMAGASYQLSERTLLDLNYRYLSVGGVTSTTDASGGASKISVGDTTEHQLRAGLRFNIQ